MNLALFGGSGATGRRILELAAIRGVAVHGLVRPGSSLGPDPAPTVTAVVGSLESDEDLDRTLAGCDAVCLVFGPRPPYTEIFCGAATERIVARMRKLGIRRIVCQTGAMIGEYRRNRTLGFDLVSRAYRWRHPGPASDRERQEAAVRHTDLDWTVLKPPRLTDAPPCFRIRASPHLRVGLLSQVPRADIADLVLGAVLNNRFQQSTIFLRRAWWHRPVAAPQKASALPLEALGGLPEESQAMTWTDAG